MTHNIRKLEKVLLPYIYDYCKVPQTKLTVAQLLNPNISRLQSFRFLRHEIPIRLAHMAVLILSLPDTLFHKVSINLVYSWYLESFKEMMEFSQSSPADHDTILRFYQCLLTIKRRHDEVVQNVAEGTLELKESEGETAISPELQKLLDHFFSSRISIRLLMTQHLCNFYDKSKLGISDKLNVFSQECCVTPIIRNSMCEARDLCEAVLGIAPRFILQETPRGDLKDPISITYIPGHVEYISFEIAKNSMRAVVEKYRPQGLSSNELPPINVDVSCSGSVVNIKVSDQGVGIPSSSMGRLFNYHYTTAEKPMDLDHRPVLAGCGYGLRLSRLYARYLGGDLSLTSTEGEGTQVLVQLNALNINSSYSLPVYDAIPQDLLLRLKPDYGKRM